ncbi:Outer membrane protein assembly factor BamB [Candidatus Magnetaquicoccaceae bacterium FCR-1]|uniref:Outer membrane protein assembly factor BamB n=1 Tax=Candidatus Magnetaquiglobus chichijimensis TaxID=3141448 RepID=A0ABQ0CBY9_9PROT
MNKRGLACWVSLTLMASLLPGCSTPTWLGGKVDEMESHQFRAPDPGKGTGLRLVWKRGVASSPDKHFVHPGRVAKDEDSIYVGTYQGRVARVKRATGDIVWEYSLGSAVMGGVAVDGERVYAGTEQGTVVALSRNTGVEVWRTRMNTAVDSAPLVVDGKVILLTLDNRSHALDATTGQPVWSHSTLAEGLVVMGSSTPTFADGLVFVGYSSGEVFALRSDNGQKAWSDNLRVLGGSSELDLMQDVDASVVFSEVQGPRLGARKAYMVNHQGRLIACQAGTGNRIWEKRLSAVRQPLWSMDRLFVVDLEGYVSAIGADDGIELWRVRLSDGQLTSPVLHKDRLVVADDQERLYTLDPASGRVLGRESLPGAVLSLPVVAADGVYFWTNRGDLLRYE